MPVHIYMIGMSSYPNIEEIAWICFVIFKMNLDYNLIDHVWIYTYNQSNLLNLLKLDYECCNLVARFLMLIMIKLKNDCKYMHIWKYSIQI